MKRKLYAIILSVAVLAEALAVFTLPVFAWSWKDDGKFEVATHEAPIVSAGSITLDALLDNAYLGGTKIENYPDESPYMRGGYSSVYNLADGSFVAYIAVDTNGLYVYAEIEDKTIFKTTNTNGNDGDCFQIYLDWCPAGVVHPSASELYSKYKSGSAWDYKSYKTNNSSNQYLGWLSGDYNGALSCWGGFKLSGMGPYKNEAVIYKTRFTNTGWACEWFVPWRDRTQKNAVANGTQFHLGIGFQSSDDSDINDTVTPGKEENVAIKFDQRREIGLSYYADYSMLSDVKFVKPCEHSFTVTESFEKTCLLDGYKTYLCTKCGGEKTEEIPASHGDEIEVVCSVAGKKDVFCADCGETVKAGIAASATGESHVFEKQAGSVEASCTEGGYHILACKYCDAEEEKTVPANGHDCYYSNKQEKYVCRECATAKKSGDVNGDGNITNEDVLEIYRYIYNPVLYPLSSKEVADVNCDGMVTNEDVLCIFRYIYNPELYPITREREELQINEICASEYSIVYAESDVTAKIYAEKLRDAIKAAAGVELEIYSDKQMYSGGKEILVGSSARLTGAASDIAAKLVGLEVGEYVAFRSGNFLYLGGGEGDAIAVSLAANDLISKIETATDGYAEIDITEGKTVTGTKYSVITYNDGGNAVTNTDQITAILNEYDPDIIGFQETQEIHLSTYSKKLGNKYNYVYFDNDGTTYNSQPIYYKKDKFTLVESGIKWLSETPDVRSQLSDSAYIRSFTYARLRDITTGNEIVVVNTHIDYTASANTKQIELLLKYTKQFWDVPVFYIADYNMQNYSTGYKIMRANEYIDCGTALGENVAGHIDFCFVDLDKSIPVEFDYINHHKYSATASDHPPVYAEILVYFE